MRGDRFFAGLSASSLSSSASCSLVIAAIFFAAFAAVVPADAVEVFEFGSAALCEEAFDTAIVAVVGLVPAPEAARDRGDDHDA